MYQNKILQIMAKTGLVKFYVFPQDMHWRGGIVL